MCLIDEKDIKKKSLCSSLMKEPELIKCLTNDE